MFWHVFKNRFKCLIRNRMVVFWTLLYPLVIATLFALAFSNLNSNDLFKSIPIAVVDNIEYQSNTAFQNALNSVSDTNDQATEKLFHVTASTKAQAEDSLKNNEIKGYIYFDNGAHVVVKDSGLDQSILKEFMDSYLQMGSAVTTILHSNPGAVIQSVDVHSYLHDVPPGRATPNSTLIYFYALIGMACMFGGFWGRHEISDVQADLSPQGARINMVPVHKLKTLVSSLCAAIVIHFLCLLVLIAYLSLVLKVDFGNQLGYVIITCLFGSIAGVSFGAMIGSLIKNESAKTPVIVGISMVLSAMAGLFALSIKTSIMQSVPVMAYINPANLISDAFYSLYYYTTYTRFFISVGLLLAVSIVFCLIVYFATRRQKYASL